MKNKMQTTRTYIVTGHTPAEQLPLRRTVAAASKADAIRETRAAWCAIYPEGVNSVRAVLSPECRKPPGRPGSGVPRSHTTIELPTSLRAKVADYCAAHGKMTLTDAVCKGLYLLLQGE